MAKSECGTYSGYAAHMKRKTVPCPECCAAKAAYMAAWRTARRERAARLAAGDPA